jgi:citronellyl-CoA dehydrogenase
VTVRIEQGIIFLFTAIEPLANLIRMTAEYTKNRKAFGQSILDNQVVHFTLAELSTEVESLRSMLYRAVGK